MMIIGKSIANLRKSSNITQQQFSEIFNVSQQSVQKWESGESYPSIDKIVQISKYFDVSLDALILGNDNRLVEEMKGTDKIKPQYENIHALEFYPASLPTEYSQSVDEGLDIEKYKDIFTSVSLLPQNEIKKDFGDIIFKIVSSARLKEGYKYTEPSSLEEIRKLRKPFSYRKKGIGNLEEKLYGAWMGRVCGCMLGKSLEGIRTPELVPFLKETGNYPMHRYVFRSDLTQEITEKYKFPFNKRVYVDDGIGMPADDDTNYTVLYQEVIEKYGRDFTPFDVSRAWLALQPKDAYCTAERVAFCNFVNGYAPPESAMYKNPYREWIGAQIRADYFGYINPGNPGLAAEMAWRDASVSHTKNGIYGEMFVAAMLAIAAETDDVEEIVLGGLAEIPHTSRLYEKIMLVVDCFRNGLSQQACFDTIHEEYTEFNVHGWCHTISNAMVVAAALLYGKGDYEKSICMAVETGFDTDCNGATVGSVLGMANGIKSIPDCWTDPIKDTLHTNIFGITTVKVSDRVKMTLKHLDM